MLMDLFHETVALSPKRRVHFHAFMAEVHAGIAVARAGSGKDPIVPVAEAIARDAALLCFDEMQITDITDAMLVGRLFEQLFDLGVVVVTTSNRPPDALYEGGWNRDQFLPFIALLKQRLQLHELAGPIDHRRNRASHDATYFSPLGADAEAAIDAVWRDIVGPRREVALRLRVQGRDLVYPRSAGRAVRCDFDDLCGGPSGARDYLALAEAVDVLIVENVPQLSARRSDAAWRFVTLVDALYEARVKLVMSADATPDDLYTDGEGAFEFARTASRLQEMQSVDWWRAT
jgi:cell division protein ZapE